MNKQREPDRNGRNPEAHFNGFAMLREERKQALREDERWLTPDDIIQAGDAYLSNGKDWWRFDDPAVQFDQPQIGKFIHLDCFCYTPKGMKKRTP